MNAQIQLTGIDADRGATFSSCRTYRYILWRWWNRDLPPTVFIGLNPSTADETEDDPTIRRCRGFARNWGSGGLIMLNLFALRATNPAELKKHPEPVGPGNDCTILETVRQYPTDVMLAWGNHGVLYDRDREVYGLLNSIACIDTKVFGMTNSGQPKHPLYLPATAIPRLVNEDSWG